MDNINFVAKYLVFSVFHTHFMFGFNNFTLRSPSQMTAIIDEFGFLCFSLSLIFPCVYTVLSLNQISIYVEIKCDVMNDGNHLVDGTIDKISYQSQIKHLHIGWFDRQQDNINIHIRSIWILDLFYLSRPKTSQFFILLLSYRKLATKNHFQISQNYPNLSTPPAFKYSPAPFYFLFSFRKLMCAVHRTYKILCSIKEWKISRKPPGFISWYMHEKQLNPLWPSIFWWSRKKSPNHDNEAFWYMKLNQKWWHCSIQRGCTQV